MHNNCINILLQYIINNKYMLLIINYRINTGVRGNADDIFLIINSLFFFHFFSGE